MKKSSSTFPIRFFSVLCTLFLSIINLHCFLFSSSRTTKKAMRKGHTRQFLPATRHVGILGLERFRGITSQREIFVTLFWASDNSRKKNSNFTGFLGTNSRKNTEATHQGFFFCAFVLNSLLSQYPKPNIGFWEDKVIFYPLLVKAFVGIEINKIKNKNSF